MRANWISSNLKIGSEWILLEPITHIRCAVRETSALAVSGWLMKQLKITVLCAVGLALAPLAWANTWYVSQSGAGAMNGADVADAQSVAWIDNGSNWGNSPAQIASGDTIYLCGTITTTVSMLGNNVTVLFQPGASISPAASHCLTMQNCGGITIDGAGGGILQNTANGTGMASQTPVYGIMASGATNVTVKNLIIQNLYVHTNPSDTTVDGSVGGGVYANGFNGTLTVSNCTFSNVPWCVNLQGPESVVNIQSNSFVNYDHGVGMGMSGTVTITIASNIFGSTANWDTGSADVYHHDGIHYFGSANISSMSICNNLFTGNWGADNTAHIYLETQPSNVLLYDNVFLQYPGDYLNDGMAVAYGNNNQIYNNTFVGQSVNLSMGLTTGGSGTTVANNLFTSLNSFVASRGTGVTFNNNVYANIGPGGNSPWSWNGTSYNTLIAWQSVAGDSKALYATNAQLNGNGSLQTNSPAIGAGTNLSGIFATDFAGLPRGAQWDAGAFAASATSALPQAVQVPSDLHFLQPGGSGSSPTNDLAGLVLWLPFEEGGGSTTVDASGHGNTCTLNNSPTWTTGIISNAIAFNGASQSVSGPNPIGGPGPITICAWVKASSPDVNKTGTVMSSGISYGFSFYNGNLAFVGDGSWYDGIPAAASASPPIDPDDGNWHYLSGTWAGGAGSFYIDGVLQGAQSLTMQTYGALNVAGAGSYYGYYSGTIDDVRVYNRALSGGEIAGQYQWPTGGRP